MFPPIKCCVTELSIEVSLKLAATFLEVRTSLASKNEVLVLRDD